MSSVWSWRTVALVLFGYALQLDVGLVEQTVAMVTT